MHAGFMSINAKFCTLAREFIVITDNKAVAILNCKPFLTERVCLGLCAELVLSDTCRFYFYRFDPVKVHNSPEEKV